MFIELPTSFGKTLLNCLNNGVLLDTVAHYLINPFQGTSLSLRAKVDLVAASSQSVPTAKFIATSFFVAHAILTRDTRIGSARFAAPLLAFDLLGDLLVVGLANGCFEIWKKQDEWKCLFRYVFPIGVVPSLIAATMEVIHVVPSKGQCLVSFDTLAALSGQSGEPVICDLFSRFTEIAARDNRVATVGCNTVLVTDWHTQVTQTVHIEHAAKAWWIANGHLLVLTNEGTLVDVSWSNGLVGVATRNPKIGVNFAIHQIQIDTIKLADCNHGILACIGVNAKIGIYHIELGRHPVSPVTTALTLLQEEPISTEDIIAISVMSEHKCAILRTDEDGDMRVEYIKITNRSP